MLCNYFTNGIDEQPGEQPIRVFYSVIEADFRSIRESLHGLDTSLGIENVRLEYLTEEIRVIGPSTNGKKITLHDTFLSFLWSYIYGVLITTPIGGKEVSNNEYADARELRTYALGLIKEYSAWDKDRLPNPELVGIDKKGFVGIVNNVFIKSVKFILLHEFAHIFMGHVKVPEDTRTQDNLWAMEMEADNIAIDWALQIFGSDNNFTGYISLVSALNSLSFTPDKFAGSLTHPEPEERILRCLEKLDTDSSEFIWGYALWSVMEWQTNFEWFYLPMTYKPGESFKVHFYDMVKELKEFKQSGINKFTIRKDL